VEKHKTACGKWLILLGGVFVMLSLQVVRLCKECLLSRTLNVYESRLDFEGLGVEEVQKSVDPPSAESG